MNKAPKKCPICGSPLENPSLTTAGLHIDLDCPTCGLYRLSTTAIKCIPGYLKKRPDAQPLLSHTLRLMQRTQERPFLRSDVIDRILKNDKLPNVTQQADNMILWLGKNTLDPGEDADIDYGKHAAIIGATSPQNLDFVLHSLAENGLVTYEAMVGLTSGLCRLTFMGWQRYEELQRGAASGSKAFMAMKFGDAELNAMVDAHFRPAVAATGYQLLRLDDAPRAGLIATRCA